MDNSQCPACNTAMKDGTCAGCQMAGKVCSSCEKCNACANAGMQK